MTTPVSPKLEADYHTAVKRVEDILQTASDLAWLALRITDPPPPLTKSQLARVIVQDVLLVCLAMMQKRPIEEVEKELDEDTRKAILKRRGVNL